MKRIIIQASARAKGNTNTVIEALNKELKFDTIDLLDYQIGHYDYEHRNQDDDFLPLIRRLLSYDLIVFATPVYWYSMSSRMKTFLDRITDCLKIEKDLGRQLRGKSMASLSCGSEPDAIPGFFYPFRESADYLGMHYLGDVHTWMESPEVSTEVLALVLAFANKLK